MSSCFNGNYNATYNKEFAMNRYEGRNLDVSNPAPRCPVILLLDVSGSMSGAPIRELNAGLRQFIEETSQDEAASRSVELEVITFESDVKIETPFTSIASVNPNPAPLSTGGCTSMGAALSLAAKELKARRKLYRDTGISCYKPWVILMTDGEPNDDWGVPAEEMRSWGEHNKIQYIGVAIGNGANMNTLRQILPADPGPVRLKGLRFKDFFRWLTDSMRSVSASAVSEEDAVQFGDINGWGEL